MRLFQRQYGTTPLVLLFHYLFYLLAKITPEKLNDAFIGEIIKTTPRNPVITAIDLRKPTISRAIITDKMVMKSDMVLKSTVAKLISIVATAKNHITNPKKPHTIRRIKSLTLFT